MDGTREGGFIARPDPGRPEFFDLHCCSLVFAAAGPADETAVPRRAACCHPLGRVPGV